MDKNQVRLALLKITVGVFALTSWVSWGFLYQTRPPEAPADLNALGALIRLPASLPAKLAPSTKVLQPIKMDIVKVSCWDLKDEDLRSTDARWIRLTGKACQNQKSDSVVVKNLSNGYVATVFPANKNSLTTDFIPLEFGKNDILIRFENEPGSALESQFSIQRQ